MKQYFIGFALSLLFTLFAYLSVVYHLLSGGALVATIFVFAMLQLFVQLFFFLHLGKEKKPYWNLVFFISTVGIILIVVVGSVWIMNHLNYNMMPGPKMDQTIIKVEGMGK